MRRAIVFFILSFTILMINCARETESVYINSLQYAEKQLKKSVHELTNLTQYPRKNKKDGSWETATSYYWVSGFFPGCLWYMYEWTSDPDWEDWARKWSAGLEEEKYDTTNHDLGFKIFCSFGNGYRLTKDSIYKEIILQASESLASRYNAKVGCIKSWNWNKDRVLENNWKEDYKFPVIIDNMMNLELLFWASKNGGKKEWYDMAFNHALKTRENHIRTNGTTYHIVQYDSATGEVKRRHTHQGYSDESTWSRGQAWGIYGFTMTYRETKDARFLETAQNLANYFINNLPEDYIPYWDFNAPNIPDEEKDSSAGAIAASGLLELSKLSLDLELKKKYREIALNMLKSLSSSEYLSKGTNNRAILLHGVGGRPMNNEVDVSLIYGDYYFIEGLLRAR